MFKSKKKKYLESASNLVRLARKVVDYRKDILSETAVQSIETAEKALSAKVEAKSEVDLEGLEASMDELDGVLKKHGGNIYPVTFWSENIEMLLVAAILAIGIRTFFFQPFKIPTNSMYPTYAGMVPHVYQEGEEPPGPVGRIFNFVKEYTMHYEVVAPADGKLAIKIFPTGLHEPVKARKFFILPGIKRKYTFEVGGEEASLTLPYEFSGFDEMIGREFLQGKQYSRSGDTFVTNRSYKKGEVIFSFDIKTGDMLFVDRFSYHFFKPEVGDAFVFRTKNIEGLRDREGNYDDKYYIKRLVGLPGDTLEVKGPALYRNGEPIEGSEAFDLNAQQVGEYEGYLATGWLSPGKKELIADDHFYAMGDNSDQSKDSRGWAYQLGAPDTWGEAHSDKKLGKPTNFVPEKEVIGKAVFIFYPFTNRWGPAK